MSSPIPSVGPLTVASDIPRPAAGPRSDPLLEIDDLRISYRVGQRRADAVRGVSLSVACGEVVAVVGESGSGKSTFAHGIVGLLPPTARVESGSVRLAGTELTRLGDRAMRRIRGRRVGFVPQDPMMSLNPTQRVGAQVGEALTLHERLDRSAVEQRVHELLADAGLPDPGRAAASYPHELSGGMRQRVLIAMAFACDPELIIADEPTSALDVTVASRVLDHLQQLVARTSCTLLIITHDLALAARRARQVVVMQHGQIVEAGAARDVLIAPTHDYTRRLVSSALHLSRTGSGVAAVVPPIPAPPPDTPALIRVDGLTKRFRTGTGKELLAVDAVSFSVPRGSTFALVGESGSGKSTTVRMVLGLEAVSAGTVEFDGADVTGLTGEDRRQLRRHMQVVYQSPFGSLDPRFTLEKIIEEPLRAFAIGDRTTRRERVAELLDRVGLPAAYAARRPAELSGGQRQRVAIARALAISPQLVVCDEPVSALDVSVQAQVLDLLAEVQRDLGVTYLFISHDLAVVQRVAHHVGVMQAGRLVESAPTAELFAHPRHECTRSLLEAAYGPDAVDQ